MSYQTAFPNFPAADMPAIPAGFVDTSWHHDACPSLSNGRVVILIDCADETLRAFPGLNRFFAYERARALDGEGDSIDTDDWDAVLAFVAEREKTKMTKQIEIACDHEHAEQFRDWLTLKGHDAEIGRSTASYIDGVRSTDEVNRLWDDYCNSN